MLEFSSFLKMWIFKWKCFDTVVAAAAILILGGFVQTPNICLLTLWIYQHITDLETNTILWQGAFKE